MTNMPQVYGLQLVDFSESIGCNKRNQVGEHTVIWSVFTGDFLVIPCHSEHPLDSLTLKYIVWQLGLTEFSFLNMWNDYIHKQKQV